MKVIESVNQLPDEDMMMLLLTHDEALAYKGEKNTYMYKLTDKNCYVFIGVEGYLAIKKKGQEKRNG